MGQRYKATIAIDFDGVIHSYENGWQGGEIYGTPTEGCEDSLKVLKRGWNLKIFTVREDLEAVRVWLEKYDLLKYFVEITNEKPIAVLYIDDRGVRHVNWMSTMVAVATLKDNGDI